MSRRPLLPTPRARALVVAGLVAGLVVASSEYWQPDSRTPVTVQVALVFTATTLVLTRFRMFRR
jgi:hypothetical protein